MRVVTVCDFLATVTSHVESPWKCFFVDIDESLRLSGNEATARQPFCNVRMLMTKYESRYGEYAYADINHNASENRYFTERVSPKDTS